MNNKDFYKQMWGEINEALFEKPEDDKDADVMLNRAMEQHLMSEEAAEGTFKMSDFTYDDLAELLG